jgi:hypothetical protein
VRVPVPTIATSAFCGDIDGQRLLNFEDFLKIAAMTGAQSLAPAIAVTVGRMTEETFG